MDLAQWWLPRLWQWYLEHPDHPLDSVSLPLDWCLWFEANWTQIFLWFGMVEGCFRDGVFGKSESDVSGIWDGLFVLWKVTFAFAIIKFSVSGWVFGDPGPNCPGENCPPWKVDSWTYNPILYMGYILAVFAKYCAHVTDLPKRISGNPDLPLDGGSLPRTRLGWYHLRHPGTDSVSRQSLCSPGPHTTG